MTSLSMVIMSQVYDCFYLWVFFFFQQLLLFLQENSQHVNISEEVS